MRSSMPAPAARTSSPWSKAACCGSRCATTALAACRAQRPPGCSVSATARPPSTASFASRARRVWAPSSPQPCRSPDCTRREELPAGPFLARTRPGYPVICGLGARGALLRADDLEVLAHEDLELLAV